MHIYSWRYLPTPLRCMNMFGPRTKITELHGRANLFITAKLNFPLTALRSATLGLLLPVTYGGTGEGGGGGAGGTGGRGGGVAR